jgi:hypothetical protein
VDAVRLSARLALTYDRAHMLTARSIGVPLVPTALLLAVAWGGHALAQDCKPRTTAVAGTLASPAGPCPAPAANAKPRQLPKKPQLRDGFWSGVTIGGSVSTTTTIRGR